MTNSTFTQSEEYFFEIIPPYNVIQIRRADIVYKNGEEISRTYNRHTVSPGDNLSKEVQQVQDIASVLWTKDITENYLISDSV